MFFLNYKLRNYSSLNVSFSCFWRYNFAEKYLYILQLNSSYIDISDIIMNWVVISRVRVIQQLQREGSYVKKKVMLLKLSYLQIVIVLVVQTIYSKSHIWHFLICLSRNIFIHASYSIHWYIFCKKKNWIVNPAGHSH